MKFLTTKHAVTLSALVLFFCLGALVFWVQRVSTSVVAEHEALAGVAGRLETKITRTHLWFEEAIAGDSSIDPQTQVFAPIEETRATALKLHTSGMLDTFDDASAREMEGALREIESEAAKWGALAEIRLQDRTNAGRIGEAQDQKFDIVFDSIIAACQKLEATASRAMQADRESIARTNIAFFALLALSLTLTLTFVVRYQRDVERKNEELESRVERRTRDLSAAKDAAEKATRAQAAFLATMSHEIRTPMNAIIGMGSLLRDTAMSQEQGEFVSTIQTASDVLLATINDVLDYSKIEAGKLELDYAEFDLRSCIEETMDMVAPAAARKRLELTTLFDPSAELLVVGDVTRFRQVALNLVNNAIKFTERGEVQVAVRAVVENGKARVFVDVADTGIGIPAASFDRLFKSFSQVDASTTRRYGGSGLGLAICKQVCELMNGSIRATSEPGKGTTFSYDVELDKPRPALFAIDSYAHLFHAKRVLIIDDNVTNRRILSLQLTRWGFVTVAQPSAEEGLAALSQQNFDLVLLDIHMPEHDGWWCANAIRARGKNLPIVVLTSTAEERQAGDRSRLSIHSILTKPIRQDRLLAMLRSVFTQESPTATSTDESRIDRAFALRYPAKILLAEDNIVNQKVALSVLGWLGYTVDVANDGLDVIRLTSANRYDVILMDVQMPHLDGLEATRRIRARGDAHRPTIIAATANASVSDRNACMDAGMDRYLTKPMRPKTLCAELELALGKNKVLAPNPNLGEASVELDEESIALLRESGVLGEVLSLFVRETTAELPRMQTQVQTGAAEELAATAHRVKGAARTIGASKLAEVCDQLQKLGKSGRTDGGEELLLLASKEFQRAQEVLSKRALS